MGRFQRCSFISWGRLAVLAWLTLIPSHGIASPLDYLRNYNLGVNLIGNNDQISVNYQVTDANAADPGCYQDLNGRRRCQESLSDHGRGLGAQYLRGYGLFLQQPFKRQGFWHATADIALGALLLSGALPPEHKNQTLNEMSYSLYGIRVKPYLQVGITPSQIFPDILISLGPVAHGLFGQVEVNGEKRNSLLLQVSRLFSGINPLAYAFFELEIVFWRFGEGAFSFYTSTARSDESNAGGSFYPGEKDGMSDFQANFTSNESGFKLLMNWP